MTTVPFQPGDRVVCICAGPTSLIEYGFCTVEFATERGARVVAHPGWYDASRFRKVVVCQGCGGGGARTWPSEDGGSPLLVCSDCNGTGWKKEVYGG